MSQKFNAATFLDGLFSGRPPQPAPDPTAAIGPDDLPVDWRLIFEERAAVREHEGGQAREHAEAEALTETVIAMRGAEGQQHVH